MVAVCWLRPNFTGLHTCWETFRLESAFGVFLPHLIQGFFSWLLTVLTVNIVPFKPQIQISSVKYCKNFWQTDFLVLTADFRFCMYYVINLQTINKCNLFMLLTITFFQHCSYLFFIQLHVLTKISHHMHIQVDA